MSKRKRPEESTLFNDINNNNMDGNDSVSLITPSSNPFNLVSPQSLLPTFLKAEQNGNGSNGTQSRPFPTLDTPPTQNQTPGIFSTPSNYMSIDTPTELTNEQHVFTMFRSNTSTVPPFGTDRLQTPGFDIPTPVLTGEHFQQPIPQASEKLVQQATLLSSISHQPPPPPTNTANLPPLPKPLPRERETRESKRRRPATPPDTDEDTDDEDSNNSSPATSSSTISSSSSSSAPPVTGGNTNSFFHIADGLNKNSNVKYLGGKQNNQYPMPPQTIEVIWNNLPRLYTDQLGLKGLHQLVCRCYVLGFDRQKRSMVSLSKVSSDKRFHETPEKRWVAVFNDIFVQYASHNYGQRLALRFQLVMIDNDDEERVLCQTDSTEFQTITKRGLEKEQQRERNRIEKHKYGAVVETVEPAIGFPVGNQLVKIYLSGIVGDSNASSNNNPQFLAQSQVTVYFGEQPSPEVHSVKKNIIICETPEHMPGEVDVVVSLVKKDNVGTCLTSKAKFRYVDPNDREALALVLRHYATKSIVKHDE